MSPRRGCTAWLPTRSPMGYRNGALARALVRGAAEPGPDVEPTETALPTELTTSSACSSYAATPRCRWSRGWYCGPEGALRVPRGQSRCGSSRARPTSTSRLSRARDALAARGIDLDTPPDVAARLGTVQAVLYLLFNEGYSASRGDALLRGELCRGGPTSRVPAAGARGLDVPSSRALVALFHLHTARFATRVDATGAILTMAEQDRGCWDQRHVHQGLRLLTTCTDAATTSRYHVEAAIAAEHVLAPSFAATRLSNRRAVRTARPRRASPLNALNRAVALAEAHGPQAGLDALRDVRLPRDSPAAPVGRGGGGPLPARWTHPAGAQLPRARGPETRRATPSGRSCSAASRLAVRSRSPLADEQPNAKLPGWHHTVALARSLPPA